MNTVIETLFTIKQVELVGRNEFATAIFDPKNEIFIIHRASLPFLMRSMCLIEQT